MPNMNPKLERALLQHYGAQHRAHLFMFAFCFVVAVLVAGWVMITRPDRFWVSTPVVAVGIPCAIGAVIFDLLLIFSRREHLLEKLRTGTQIRSVQRGANATIFVELADGRTSALQSPDGNELARIEELLRRQMEMAR
jgi:hypothetical protein